MLMNKVAPLPHDETSVNLNHNIIPPQFQSCRICLEGPQDGPSVYKIIRPCKCTGSIQSVHQRCMLLWIQSQLKARESISRNYDRKIFCEICKARIYYDYKTQLQWNFSLECNNINGVNTCFLGLLMMMLIAIAILVIIIDKKDLIQINDNGLIILVITLTLVCVTALLVLMAIIRLACSKKTKKIDKIYDQSEICNAQQLTNSSQFQSEAQVAESSSISQTSSASDNLQ